jgi:hypothetical protein
MDKTDLEQFLSRLEELLEINGCNDRDSTNAEIILEEMGIAKEDQKKFLENCRESGGFCDCEIFLNSEDYLREIYED